MLCHMSSVFHVSVDALEFIPGNYIDPLELKDVFPRRPDALLEADLGCGDGAFLTARALQHPERNFLGVERLVGRVRRTCRRLFRAEVSNARVMRVESHYAIRYLLPPGSASVVHLMFPDPWPKRRHQGNRLFQCDFLEAVHNVLAPSGELRLTTDNAPYFQQMHDIFESHPGFEEKPWCPGEEYPQTDFERRFRAEGLPIYRALLRKITRAGETDGGFA